MYVSWIGVEGSAYIMYINLQHSSGNVTMELIFRKDYDFYSGAYLDLKEASFLYIAIRMKDFIVPVR